VRTRAVPPPAVGAVAAVVIDAGSGAVLWGREEHTPLQPASVTKIVTALIAVERGNLDEPIRVDLEQRLLSRGTTMGLVTGDWFTLRDLLYGLMLPSGNAIERWSSGMNVNGSGMALVYFSVVPVRRLSASINTSASSRRSG
jgi:D-alanyl-D-alanine carboxypeptidase